MKFKWVGLPNVKSLDLVYNEIMEPQDTLNPGDILEIPDDNKELIQKLKANLNYEVYIEPKKVGRPKKNDKKEEKEEEE